LSSNATKEKKSNKKLNVSLLKQLFASLHNLSLLQSFTVIITNALITAVVFVLNVFFANHQQQTQLSPIPLIGYYHHFDLIVITKVSPSNHTGKCANDLGHYSINTSYDAM